MLGAEVTDNYTDLLTGLHITVRIAEQHVISLIGLDVFAAVGGPERPYLGGHGHRQFDIGPFRQQVRFDAVIKQRQGLLGVPLHESESRAYSLRRCG